MNYMELFFFLQIVGIIIFILEVDFFKSLMKEKKYVKISKLSLFLSLPSFTMISLYLNPYIH